MNDRVEKFVASGARVVLLLEPPQVHYGQPGVTASDVAYEHMNALLKEVAAKHAGRVTVVNLGARVCPSGPPCPFVVDGFGSTGTPTQQDVNAIRPDGVHYLPSGSLWVARWLVPQIVAADKKLS
jgi:hypothetical protein